MLSGATHGSTQWVNRPGGWGQEMTWDVDTVELQTASVNPRTYNLVRVVANRGVSFQMVHDTWFLNFSKVRL
jgi:hypothetical protein